MGCNWCDGSCPFANKETLGKISEQHDGELFDENWKLKPEVKRPLEEAWITPCPSCIRWVLDEVNEVMTNPLQEMLNGFPWCIKTLVQMHKDWVEIALEWHRKWVETVSNMFSYMAIEWWNLEEKVWKIKEKLVAIQEEMEKNWLRNMSWKELIALGEELITLGIYEKESYLEDYLQKIEERKITPLEETWIGGELKFQKSKREIIKFMIGDLEKVIELIDWYVMSKQNSFFLIASKLEEIWYDVRDYKKLLSANPFAWQESQQILNSRNEWNAFVDETTQLQDKNWVNAWIREALPPSQDEED